MNDARWAMVKSIARAGSFASRTGTRTVGIALLSPAWANARARSKPEVEIF
jgi:hypothetical protein